MAERAQIIIKGIVQGVGFRPYVFNLAESLSLKGYVTNTSEGVLVDVEGAGVAEFLRRVRNEAPPLSNITGVTVTQLPLYGYPDFAIRKSVDQTEGLPFTLVSPDVSLCDDCLRELLDPANRRYLYPFINCTNCGPRYSITRSVPYDRPNTTMAGFTLCPACLAEYDNPRDRRFHAQPNACPKCGPRVEFRVRSAECGVRSEEAIRESIKLLKNGGIVAIKGLGGFHIACDAENDSAVQRLRERKRKSNKPFGVMAPTVEHVRQYCLVSDEEEATLSSKRRPIVLLHKREGRHLAEGVSPDNQYVGSMLPYTPLHYLLFYHPLGSVPSALPHFNALVMTSGNLSEEPIIHTNEDALQKLSSIVDGFLLHDRDIFMRVDDSVLRVRSAECGVRNEVNSKLKTENSEQSFLRRSRGYAPDPIPLSDDGPEGLACGADLKNTFTLTKGAFAITSQHIGDMENYETVKFFEESLANLKAVYRADPKVIVHDLHPGYLSTQWAQECGMRSTECGVRENNSKLKTQNSELKLFAIQHHYAHIGSVMAEHGLKEKVIGVAFDGTGYGTDGRLWGGEFLIADIDGFERTGHFQYMALPGGETAIREPWRTATGLVMNAAGEKAWEYLELIGYVGKYGKDLLEKITLVARSLELSPLASGAGRLFDVVSALIGICDRNTFEGEAAMALESCTREGIDGEYAVEFMQENGYTVVQFQRTIMGILNDIRGGLDKGLIATRFHNTVASVIQIMVKKISEQSGIMNVALSGGTFQNRYLLNRVSKALTSSGKKVFLNQKVPCNDGGISLGQAYLVRERLNIQCGMSSAECGI